MAQRCIAACQGREEAQVRELLLHLGPRLRRTANGRHIMCAARKRFGASALQDLTAMLKAM